MFIVYEYSSTFTVKRMVRTNQLYPDVSKVSIKLSSK